MEFLCSVLFKIKVLHPNFPSTRVSVQVPNLGIHISPARYCRLMELLNIFYSTLLTSGQAIEEDFKPELAPWNPADMATKARILVRKVCCLHPSCAYSYSYHPSRLFLSLVRF